MKGPNNKAYVAYSKKYPKGIIQYGLHDLLKRKERMLCPKNMYSAVAKVLTRCLCLKQNYADN